MTSAPSSSRRRPATAVLPEAVGPKSAMTLRAGGCRLLEAMLDLGRAARALERPVFLGMGRTPLAEPRDRARDALRERRLRLPAEQPARPAHVRDVVRHLAEQRRREADLRVDTKLSGDQLRRADERVALAEREVDRLVRDPVL